MKNSYKLLTISITLASLLCLTACQQASVNKESKAKTPQVSKQSSNTSSTQSSEKVEQSQSTEESSSTESSTSSSESEPQTVTQTIDPMALFHGDFSSIKGTWKNAQNDTMTIDDNGNVSINSNESGRIMGRIPDGDSAYLTVGHDDSPIGGYAIVAIPANKTVKSSYSNNTDDMSDQTKDRMVVGQNISLDNPAVFYYRVN